VQSVFSSRESAGKVGQKVRHLLPAGYACVLSVGSRSELRDVRAQMISQLLQEMDATSAQTAHVVVLAATNLPQVPLILTSS
jgi:SpoVK/Ycf46/Vps4 family AAA+-type ATPase